MTYPIWDAYAATLVEVRPDDSPPYVIAAAAPGIHGDWPFPGHGHAWVITACNPRSVQLSDAENAARHAALHSDLVAVGMPFVETLGREAAGDWREPGYVVPGLAEELATALAERYEQNAAFHWTPTEWAIHGVLQPGRRTLGWTLTLA